MLYRRDKNRSETIITSLLTSGVTLLICLINNHNQNNATRALIEYRLQELEKQVSKHNNVIERTYHLEETTALHTEKIKVANNRIADIEAELKKGKN